MKVYIKDLYKLKPMLFDNYHIFSDSLTTNQTLDNIYNYTFIKDKEVYVFDTTTYNSRFKSKIEVSMDISFMNIFNNIYFSIFVGNGIYYSI